MESVADKKQRRSTCRPRSPNLLDFAPNLMSKLNSSPPSSSTKKVDRDRRPRSESSQSSQSPLRSPLHTNRRGGRRGGFHGRHGPRSRGSYSSRGRAAGTRSPPSVSTPAVDDGECGQSEDRQVRKRLWADEVDEAFVEGDLLDDTDTQLAVSNPQTPTKEQLARRQKDIDYGKATQGYKNYLHTVPKDQRGTKYPQTPNKTSKVARRAWDNNVRSWRRALHEWDFPSPSLTPASSPSTRFSPYGAGKKTPTHSKRGPLVGSTTSSPSDRGYSTTPDSKADNSSQDLDDEDDYWMRGESDFPSPRRDWGFEGGDWDLDDNGGDALDWHVQKLKIEGADLCGDGDGETGEGLEEEQQEVGDQVPL